MSSHPKFRVAAFAFDVRPGEVAHNLSLVKSALRDAANEGAKLLLLPEKWTTSFLPEFANEVCLESDDALTEVHQMAQELDLIVIGSAPGQDQNSGLDKPFNELHFLGHAGDLRPYRKRALFSPTGEGRQCQAGTQFPATIETRLGKICGVICYDLRFPELTRPSFWDGADLLVVSAQWPSPRAKILELLAKARAAENQQWVLICNRSGSAPLGDKRVLDFPGNAMLVNPLGEVVAEIEHKSSDNLLIADIDLEVCTQVRKQVPCRRDAGLANLKP